MPSRIKSARRRPMSSTERGRRHRDWQNADPDRRALYLADAAQRMRISRSGNNPSKAQQIETLQVTHLFFF